MTASDFLSGGGEMGALMRAHDWAATPLGPAEAWPQSLRTVVRLILNTNHPMYIFWGAEGACLYNDAFRQSIGAERHPSSLGRPAVEVWEETWAVIGPQLNQVMAGGGATWHENALVPMTRNGGVEDVYWTYSYSPIDDESAAGGIGGVLVACTETTQHVRQARDLAAGRERQERNLGQMPGFAAILSGPDHVFDYVNEAYVRISGPRAFIGLSVREVFPELAGQGFYELLDEVFRSGQRFVADGHPIRLASEDADRFIDFVYEPIFDAEGEVTGIFVGGYDATAAHRSAQALRALNAELESRVVQRAQARGRTWQVTPDLMGALNAGGYFETSNPAWLTVLGWSEEEVARTCIWDLLHPDDIEHTRAGFDLTQIGEPAVRFPNRYRHKDGSYRWISWVGVPEDGLVYCTGRDITEEKAQAAELAARTAERDLLASIVESTDTMVMVAALNYDILAINTANADEFERIYGIRPRPGDNMLDLLADQPDHQAQVRATWGRGLAGEEVTLVEEFGNSKFAKAFYEISFRPLRDAAGHRIGCYQFVRDVTERHREQTALAEAQEQLRQAQKMEAVGQLTGGLAHDFNNLLAGISGSLELIRTRMAQGRSAEVDRYVVAAQGAASRAASLTHRLLAFSRRQTLAPKPTDVKQLVNGMAELIGRTVGPAIQVETVNGAGLWPSLIDPSQLENAILNLCINARDAMSGGGKITIETSNRWLDRRMARERGIEPGQYISLCVADTGSGMPPEVVAKAFDPFFTTKPIGVGTGLGLSMIYGFAKQSGGAVNIYSEPGRGTTVCIYLPRHVGAAALLEAPTEPAEPPRGLEGETVLVVDDEPTVRMLVTEVLNDLGYAALEAEDGAAGLKILNSEARIDLLVTDVGLPGGLNGRQVADAARGSRPDLKVLFITGFAENAVLSHGHLEPGMHVMTKPFAMDAMATRIRELISG